MDHEQATDQNNRSTTGESENPEVSAVVEKTLTSETTASPKPKRRRVGTTRSVPATVQAGHESGCTQDEGTRSVPAPTASSKAPASRGRGRGRRPRLSGAASTDLGRPDAPSQSASHRGAHAASNQRHARGGRTGSTSASGGRRAASSMSESATESVPEQGSFSQFMLVGSETDRLPGSLVGDPASLETADDGDRNDRLDEWLFPECGQLLTSSVALTEQAAHEFRSFRELTNEQFELLTEAQKERYIEFRRAALRPQNLRRFVNALVGGTSGYAPGHPFLVALQGLGKMFIGDLVETAVQIKCEWDRNRQIAEYGEPMLGHPIGPDGALQAPLEPRHIREAYRRLQQQGHLFSVLYAGRNNTAGHASSQNPNGFLTR
ncbi:hypothetical protein CCYA_CCYA13G3480 [Cyanidiococcus yangmingshanensis]|nr:hypothetical protein CCYA_CCYA13G3480 [Cyanidiococcus yangmingshanensis]